MRPEENWAKRKKGRVGAWNKNNTIKEIGRVNEGAKAFVWSSLEFQVSVSPKCFSSPDGG